MRIPGEFMSEEFNTAYMAALAGVVQPGEPVRAVQQDTTLSWLVARYRESQAWQGLSAETRKQSESHFRKALETAGDYPYAEIEPGDIEAARQRRLAESPSQAECYMKAMKRLFAWAASPASAAASPSGKQLLRVDPAAGLRTTVKRTARERADDDDPYSGFPAWTEQEVTRYEQHWPVGTRERLLLALFLHTGLRISDAAVLGWSHIENNIIKLRTKKTHTWVAIRMLPEFKEVLDASPTGTETVIGAHHARGKSRIDGRPVTPKAIGQMLGKACEAAQIEKSAHGLRKLAAIRMALNGATVSELNATFGWKGSKMAMLYTEYADRTRLSLGAAEKMRKRSV